MVYDWAQHRHVITRLYVDESKPVDEIIRHMRTHYGFTPSKRQFQTQFRAWDFPGRHHAALNNERLVARVKELWERNLSHDEMHRVLTEEDGFDIKSRALLRVRRHHKWLLRAPVDKKDSRGGRSQSPATPALQQHQGLLPDGNPDDSNSGGAFSLRPAADEDSADDGHAGITKALLVEERRRKMEAESSDRWASKKRRRRTRQWAGMPADPPGPPRFRSETTIAESLVILGLDKALYGAVRDEFQSICEAMHIIKKTLAGPEVWENAKHKLVAAIPHLQRAMWSAADLDRNKLALDVICCDVTKRMRAACDKGVTLADAKNILGMNPDELRKVKATFFKMLEEDGATSKIMLGNKRWEELKQRWIDECELLRTTLARLYGPADEELRAKAIETLARDVMKRRRDKYRERKNPKRKGQAVADDTADAMFDDDDDDDDNAVTTMTAGLEDGSDFATMLVPHQSHRPRMPPSHLVDPRMHVGIQLDAQLLLHPSAQNGFMDSHQQFMPPPPPMAPIAPMAPIMAAMPNAPSPYDAPQGGAFDMSAQNTPLIPIYLRELAHDHMGPMGELWIALLTSPRPSLDELRHVAAQKLPGSTCLEVHGMVKVPGMAGYVPLMIHDDDHLAAHLAQEATPEFHVRLAF